MRKWRNCTFLARSRRVIRSIQVWCGDQSAGRVPVQRRTEESSLSSHQMAVPRQRRTENSRLRDASPVPCFVTNQGTERAVLTFVLDAVAGVRRTGQYNTGGVPPKPPATIFLSAALRVLGLRFTRPEALRRPSAFALSRQPCGLLGADCCGCGKRSECDVAASECPRLRRREQILHHSVRILDHRALGWNGRSFLSSLCTRLATPNFDCVLILLIF